MTVTPNDSARIPRVTTPAASPSSRGTGYRELWRSVPGELAFLLVSLPIVTAGFIVTVVLATLGAGTLVIWVGLPIFVAALACARAFGEVELRRLAAAGQPAVPRPMWKRATGGVGGTGEAGPDRPAGVLSWFRRTLGDRNAWLYLLHTAVVGFAAGLFSWIVAVTWTVSAAGGLTWWFWARFVPTSTDDGFWLHRIILEFLIPGFRASDTADGLFAGESILYLVCGVALLASLPFVTRALVRMHHGIAVGMLGESPSAALRREVAELDASRGSAVIAEDHSLRRLERDIHDGPQQRLIRLQYDISSAERAMDADPAAARALLTGALRQSKDTLDELRQLSRGFAPPILQDRGLAAAIESLAAQSTIPVHMEFDFDGTSPALVDIERSAYFVVAELLANVAKHSGATEAHVAVGTATGAGARTLRIVVGDNGAGGAIDLPSHGLAGLRERVAGLRGTMVITSPAGGPTLVSVDIPYTTVPRG